MTIVNCINIFLVNPLKSVGPSEAVVNESASHSWLQVRAELKFVWNLKYSVLVL